MARVVERERPATDGDQPPCVKERGDAEGADGEPQRLRRAQKPRRAGALGVGLWRIAARIMKARPGLAATTEQAMTQAGTIDLTVTEARGRFLELAGCASSETRVVCVTKRGKPLMA